MGSTAFNKFACIFLLFFTPCGAMADDRLKVVTYNTHGGHGNAEVNLQKFKDLLQGDEQVLCLQEIKPDIWPIVQAVFADFAYAQIVWRQTTDALGLFESPQREGGAIFSKIPFLSESEHLIQIDPGGDMWERKAGFVKIPAVDNVSADIFIGCYHNTYNFNDNDFASEQEGIGKFREISLQEMEATTLDSDRPFVLAGDFNLFEDKIANVLPDAPFTYSVGRDHIATNIPIIGARKINTRELEISDHDAVVVTLDIEVSVELNPDTMELGNDESIGGQTGDDEDVTNGSGGALPLEVLLILMGLFTLRKCQVIFGVDCAIR